MPEAFSRIWYYVISTLVFGVGIGVLAQPQLGGSLYDSEKQ
jgi:hypothetical protein